MEPAAGNASTWPSKLGCSITPAQGVGLRAKALGIGRALKINRCLRLMSGTSRNIYFRFAHRCGRDQRSERKTLGYAWLCE